MAKDLVCNMEVDERTAKGKSIYKGETYYFCAPSCKSEFDENPEKYVGDSSKGHGGHHGCCCSEY